MHCIWSTKNKLGPNQLKRKKKEDPPLILPFSSIFPFVFLPKNNEREKKEEKGKNKNKKCALHFL
jgi:hypothetical protein